MALCPLPPGLAPDVVEKLRWETFGHRRSCCLSSVSDLLRFTKSRGFVLVHPRPGVHYPSLLEATVGRPLPDFAWDERARTLEEWRFAGLRARKVVAIRVLAGQPSLASPATLVDFFAASGHDGHPQHHEKLHENGALDVDTLRVCRAVFEHGPLDVETLAAHVGMQQPAAHSRLQRALGVALHRLLVVEVDQHADGHPDAPRPVYDLMPRAFARQVERAARTSPEKAREHIVCRYLRNVLVEASHEIARVLGWKEDVTLATCRALLRRRAVVEHPASRRRRHLFQAAATDLLAAPPNV